MKIDQPFFAIFFTSIPGSIRKGEVLADSDSLFNDLVVATVVSNGSVNLQDLMGRGKG